MSREPWWESPWNEAVLSGSVANPEMVANYCPEILDATYFGAAGNTGEAIRWAVDLGAAMENMDAYQGHASLAHPHGTLLTWGVIIQGGFLVNQSGQRFGNENEGYSGFAVQVLGQPQGLAFAIFDEPIYLALSGFGWLCRLCGPGGNGRNSQSRQHRRIGRNVGDRWRKAESDSAQVCRSGKGWAG